VQRTGRDDGGQLAREIDDRITALGRMIRSDNLALAAKMQAATEQPAAKQALRAVKELQANLPNEIQRIVEDRVQAISEQLHRDVQASAESVAKLGEGLERKFEQATARIGQRHDKELQVVMGRMGDAMHALASLSRQEPEPVELD
jgi:predicted Holliday junction resolvase-like endonuclease